ncbi:MAG: 2,3-bisphosphoglycerate-independent phosphoglycerate mutase [Clostridia bacterium]|nr:2,3-bisphosphoglycerate-independent phosphoglycerate mutase [Clostridia bacterium]
MSKKPYAIIIMDGFGYNPDKYGNAIEAAGIPNVKKLFKEYPSTFIGASGMDVGLPDGQMGNSEVGHLNIGAGRIVYQDLTKITKAISDGDFFTNAALVKAMDNAVKNGKKLHLYGLLSTGGVHSHITHVYALLKMAKERGVKNTYVHCFLDGRDTDPKSGAGFVADLQAEMDRLAYGKIASVCGRYYAMDRDNNWDRTLKAYDMLTLGTGEINDDAVQAVKDSYEKGVTDEFILPTNIVKDGKPVALIEKGDSVIFFNFRPDRARQITRAFSQEEFTPYFDEEKGKQMYFERKTGYLAPVYTGFAVYDASFKGVFVAFPPDEITNTLPQYLSSLGKTQLHIAETEKYAHVTFFFNAKLEAPVDGETRIVIPSPKVATYDLKPEMSAFEVKDRVITELSTGKYDVMILNFANCDMVGHTGVFDAAVNAVKTVDTCVKEVVDKILDMDGAAIITADHGNADKMLDEEGKPFTAHTTNIVPFIVVGEEFKGKTLKNGGKLCDIAPTLLSMMKIKKPEEMSGESLIEK